MGDRGEIITGYFPVFHAGYLELLNNHPQADVGVLGAEVLRPRFDYLRKDIRALAPEQAVSIITGLQRTARLIGEKSLSATLNTERLIMPDDDISHSLAEEFNVAPIFDPVFLRWDRNNSSLDKVVIADRLINLESDDKIIRLLHEQQERSTNWWRHVAAAIIKDDKILSVSHNSSVPTQYTSAIEGDPRITANRGLSIETSLDMHAEARVITELVKNGQASLGADIFVTTFPCPNCAKLIAESGFRSCYFIEGYAMLDGQNILQANNVEIVKIDTEQPSENPKILKAYPTS